MATATEARTWTGACHCGRLRLAFSSRLAAADLVPRACDCSFCRKHGAAWLSDPQGRLSVSAAPGALHRYRQGANAADFLLCRECGVLVAVVFEQASRVFGAVNGGCLDAAADLPVAVPVSPQTLAPDARQSRWLQLWVPDVALSPSGE